MKFLELIARSCAGLPAGAERRGGLRKATNYVLVHWPRTRYFTDEHLAELTTAATA